jgi:hypothetical protein
MFIDIYTLITPFLSLKEIEGMMHVCREMRSGLQTNAYLRRRRRTYLERYKRSLMYMYIRSSMTHQHISSHAPQRPTSPLTTIDQCHDDTWLIPSVQYAEHIEQCMDKDIPFYLFT